MIVTRNEDVLVIDCEGGVPCVLRRGDKVELTINGEPTMRVALHVLQDDERWPTPTLARLEEWLEAHGLERRYGIEILRMMNQ